MLHGYNACAMGRRTGLPGVGTHRSNPGHLWIARSGGGRWVWSPLWQVNYSSALPSGSVITVGEKHYDKKQPDAAAWKTAAVFPRRAQGPEEQAEDPGHTLH